MYIKKKNGKIIKIKTPWDILIEQQQLIILQKSIHSGIGSDVPSSSGSAA